MLKIQRMLFAILVIFQGNLIANESDYIGSLEEYRIVRRPNRPWGSKFFKSIIYGTFTGAATGGMCALFDNGANSRHWPLHWAGSLVSRKVANGITIEWCEESGYPVNADILEDTSFIASWLTYLYIMAANPIRNALTTHKIT